MMNKEKSRVTVNQIEYEIDIKDAEIKRLRDALSPLKAIADAYDDNSLNDEARKVWGKNNELTNTTPTDQIQLYSGRGGRELLTLAHCLEARNVLDNGMG